MKKLLVYILFFIQVFMFSQNSKVKYYLPGVPNSRVYKILEKVREKEKVNHPNVLNSYSYYLYTKFYIDDYNVMNRLKTTDSLKISEFGKKELILLGERVVKCSYDRRLGQKKEIMADQVSGLKKPLYELFEEPIFQEEFPKFIKDDLHSYNFKLIDSITIENKLNYVISFGSKKNLLVNGSRGTIYIDAKSFAVVKYSGEEYNTNYTRYFEYKWKPFEDIWFLENKTNKIKISTIDVSKFFNIQDQKYLLTPWIVIEMNVSKFTSDKKFSYKDFKGYTHKLNKDYNKNTESKIDSFRNDPLTQREKNTYVYSTLFNTFSIEKNVRFLNSIKNGKLPLGKIDLNLLNLMNYNDFEGFRFQVGGKTNYSFNANMSLHGYVATGTKNTPVKGALGIDLYVNKENDGKIKFLGFSDVNPFSKHIERYSKNMEQVKEELNYIQNSIFYTRRGGEISYEQDILKNITTSVKVDYENQKSNYEYSHKYHSPSHRFNLFTTSLQIKYAPFAKYLQTPEGKMTLEDKPIYFYFDYIKGLKFMGADFSYDRFDIAAHILIKNPLGTSSMMLNSGYISGKTTLWNNYGSFGDAKQGSSIWDRFSIKGLNSFETLLPGDFYADKYVAFFLNQTFKEFKFLFSRKTQLSLIYNGMIGNMKNKEIHTIAKIAVPNKYYQEVGLELNKLIYYVGFGVYYRVGAYHQSTFDKNLFIKLTFNLF